MRPGQPVQGLTWTSSDSNVVSLSSDDPPLLSAVAAGHATVTAGDGSADIDVYSDMPPLGTVLWSNPGNGSGVYSIVPAVPSPDGVADVFAFQYDGTVQAITSEGATAWTADVSRAMTVLPDFQGGLVVIEYDESWSQASIVKLDGTTGQRYPAYSPGDTSSFTSFVGVHTDGTVFAVLHNWDSEYNPLPPSVIGVDPITGTAKFSVSLPGSENEGRLIVAGDGYAYVPWIYRDWSCEPGNCENNHLMLLRVSTDGAYENIVVFDWMDWPTDLLAVNGSVITNGDNGVLFAWENSTYENGCCEAHLATVSGSGASLTGAPTGVHNIVPVLQAQDGSFVGTAWDDTWTSYMIAFDGAGNLRWSVPNYTPQIATADGGVIATADEDGSATTFDQDGNPTEQIGYLPIYSWTSNAYQIGSVNLIVATGLNFALSWWPFAGANASSNLTAHFRKDSKANQKVKDILTPTRWQKFTMSNCAAVFQEGLTPFMSYSLKRVQQKAGRTNFYDVGNPGIGNLTVLEVTGGQYGSNVTLSDYLLNAGADAATANIGYDRQTAVVLAAAFLDQPHPQFTLVHEVLLHAYAGWWDQSVFANGIFQQHGLWRPDGSTATINISTWMSTDCTCTPGKPGTTCQADTATW
jgi:hypothetical protein